MGYWAVSVGDGRNTFIAYGAKVTDEDGKSVFNLSRIQKRLGESRFTRYYCNGPKKNFKSYNALVKYLSTEGGKYFTHAPFENDLIEAGNDERYYLLSC